MNIPAHESEEITPPSSLRGLPLTPPPTDEKGAPDTSYILREIAKHRSYNTGQTIFKVDKRVWAALSPLLLRPDKSKYTRKLRLSGRISEQLRLLSRGFGSAADFAKDIRHVGSTTIRPRDPEYGTHDPDSSFHHLKSPSSTVIIEVAHIQREKKLRTLADDYILGSNLEIRVVVGVDIEYSKSKRATFSIWRARIQNDKVWVVEPTVENQIFRYDDGKPNVDQNAGLRLRLEDFADQKVCRQFEDLDRDIFVSYTELYQYLEEAEVMTKISKSTKPVRDPLLIKRPRTKTPKEELDERDQAAYAEDEERVSKRQDLDDSSYKESSSECS
ncbi:MAG: hypothetical protein Q9163_006319 [Psora crenata]